MKKSLLTVFLLSAAAVYAAPGVKDLTTDELIGQTLVVRIDAGEHAPYEQAIKDGLIGTVLIKGGSQEAGNAAEKRALTQQTIADLRRWEKQSRHQIPLLIAFDYEGGAVVSPLFLGFKQLPSNMLLSAASTQQDLVTPMFRAAAREIKALDGQIDFAPVLDVNTNPLNPIIGTRSFGADAPTVGKYGVRALKGLQKERVAAFAKHFPGHGDTVTDSHTGSPVMDLPLEQLDKQHIAAFRTAIKKGVWGVMSSHVIYPALDKENPASFSRTILTDLLRKDFKFKGVIASDSLDMAAAARPGGMPQAAAEAYAAGADMPLIGKDLPYDTIDYVKTQIGQTLTHKQLQDSARRVLKLKKKTGLFSARRKQKNDDENFSRHAQNAARHGVTLVKNERGQLPLNTENKTVCAALFSEPILKNQALEILMPFKQAGWQTAAVYAEQTPAADTLEKARECAQNAGLFIIGSTQKYDRPDPAQQTIIQTLLAEFPNAVLVSMLSPYDVNFYPQAATVLAVYGPTPQTMQAAGEILLGTLTPVGKLPVPLR